MHYVILTKLEYPTSVSLRVKGLRPDENKKMIQKLSERKIKHTNGDENNLEADLTGVEMLNLLGSSEFRYRVVSQAMAMEHSSLGGRSFQIEKVVWTLENEDNIVSN